MVITRLLAALLLLGGCTSGATGTGDGDTGSGDNASGDAASGDNRSGDAQVGDSRSGDAQVGDTRSGDVRTGDSLTGDTVAGDTLGGDASTGDTPSGDTSTGDTPSGDTRTGDTATGDTLAGDAFTGDRFTGDTLIASNPPHQLRFTADDAVPVASVATITATVLDVNGVIVTSPAHQVTFALDFDPAVYPNTSLDQAPEVAVTSSAQYTTASGTVDILLYSRNATQVFVDVTPVSHGGIRHGQEDIVFFDDVESGSAGWLTSNAPLGLAPVENWEQGVPLLGPPTAHSGASVWATDLDANYTQAAVGVTQLSRQFDVAAELAAEPAARVTVSTWEWFDVTQLDSACGGSEEGEGAGFMLLPCDAGDICSTAVIPPDRGFDGEFCLVGLGLSINSGQSGGWLPVDYDVTDHANASSGVFAVAWALVRGAGLTAPGWYLDDISVTVGHPGRVRVEFVP